MIPLTSKLQIGSFPVSRRRVEPPTNNRWEHAQEGNHVRPLAASLLPTYSVNHSVLFSPYSGLGSSSSHAEFVVVERPFFPGVVLLQR